MFELGQILMTPGAEKALESNNQAPFWLLARHHSCDWGVVPPEDAEENNIALVRGYRLISAYLLNDGTKVWIITEANRSATTILLPSEY